MRRRVGQVLLAVALVVVALLSQQVSHASHSGGAGPSAAGVLAAPHAGADLGSGEHVGVDKGVDGAGGDVCPDPEPSVGAEHVCTAVLHVLPGLATEPAEVGTAPVCGAPALGPTGCGTVSTVDPARWDTPGVLRV